MKLTRDEHMRAEGALNALDIAGTRILELEAERDHVRDELDDVYIRLWGALGQPLNVNHFEAVKQLVAERDTAIHMRDIEERNKIDHLNTLEKVEAERDALKAQVAETYQAGLATSAAKGARIRELEIDVRNL